jgi:hypothetical protein
MANWTGTRDYNEWLEAARQEYTEDLLESVKCDIYCIATIYKGHAIEEHFDWIVVWNSYVELKTNLDVLAERGIDRYSTKLAAEAILARLKNALDKCRAEGRDKRLARKIAKAKQRVIA